MSELLKNDVDPIETNDWLAAIDSLIREEGIERAQFIIDQVMQQARAGGVSLPSGITTDYVNTIPVSEQPAYPGNLEIERRIRSYVRWNAVMMVLRGQKKDLDLGGHLSRSAWQRFVFLPSPEINAGFLAILHCFYGFRPGERHLSSPFLKILTKSWFERYC